MAAFIFTFVFMRIALSGRFALYNMTDHQIEEYMMHHNETERKYPKAAFAIRSNDSIQLMLASLTQSKEHSAVFGFSLFII